MFKASGNKTSSKHLSQLCADSDLRSGQPDNSAMRNWETAGFVFPALEFGIAAGLCNCMVRPCVPGPLDRRSGLLCARAIPVQSYPVRHGPPYRSASESRWRWANMVPSASQIRSHNVALPLPDLYGRRSGPRFSTNSQGNSPNSQSLQYPPSRAQPNLE